MSNTVLVAGASGLVGAAVVDRFLDDGWGVVAVSRRRPEVFSDKPFTHLAVDLQDETACQQAFRTISDVPTWSTARSTRSPPDRRVDRAGPDADQP